MQQPPTAQPAALPPGSVLLDRYQIAGYVGGGGFGYIYEARDLALGHRRAIKETFAQDPLAQQQFRLEAEFLLNVAHPHLVRGYAVFEQGGRYYLVMDYVDGQTLEDIAIEHIRRTSRALPEAQVIRWLIPICEAVQALHAQPVPIIHRDVKPANIKLSAGHGPVLMDLGLAKLYADGSQTLRAALAFTPGYAPPEQYRATGATDRRTDIYGLGATLFYLFTGYQPTEAPARLSAQALPTPRALNPLLTGASEAVVVRAMALDPAGRYQDALAMAADLRAALGAIEARGPTLEELTLSGGMAPVSHRRPCPRCGAPNPARARYCMGCGAAIAGTGAPRLASDPAPLAQHPLAAPAEAERLPRAVASPPRPASGGAGTAARAADARPARPARPQRRIRSRPVPMAPAIARGGAGDAAELAARLASQLWPPPVALAVLRGLCADVLRRADATGELEAWTSIAALVASSCLALSLMAPFVRGMLPLVAPALVLGHWSLARQPRGTPRAFRWLALATVVLAYSWLALWIVQLFAHR